MRKAAMLTAIVIGVCVVVAGGTTTANADKATSSVRSVQTAKPENKCNKWEIVKGIRFYRASMWMWQWQEGIPLGRVTKWRPRHSCAFLQYLAVRARERSLEARRSFQKWFNRAYAKWECIHSHEGAWNDDNAPFWGGLQMDKSFMQTYGADFIRAFKGYANVWPVWAQLRAADRAHASGRGFYPWPNTARYCGLI